MKAIKHYEPLLNSEPVFSHYGVDDPKIRAEAHLKLCEKYLKEGEELLAKKDYVQASEKFWGRPRRWLRPWRLRGAWS